MYVHFRQYHYKRNRQACSLRTINYTSANGRGTPLPYEIKLTHCVIKSIARNPPVERNVTTTRTK